MKNHRLLYLLAIFIISGCQDATDKLLGHWVCVKGCDQYQTLDFFKDSLEINRYLRHLRAKENNFFKIKVGDNAIDAENIFYDERRNFSFHYKLVNDTLLFGSSYAKFVRRNSVPEDDFNNFHAWFLDGFTFPTGTGLRKKRFNHLNADLIFIKRLNKALVFIYNNQLIPIDKLESALFSRKRNLAEEETKLIYPYFIPDANLEMGDFETCLQMISEHLNINMNSLLYKDTSEQNKKGVPENLYDLYYYPSGQLQNTLSFENGFIYNNSSNKKINYYLNYSGEKTNNLIHITNNIIYCNGKICRNENELISEIDQIYSPESNPANFIEVDSGFFSEIIEYANSIDNIPDDEKYRFYDDLLRKFNFNVAVFDDYPVLQMPVIRFKLALSSDKKTSFQKWFSVLLKIEKYMRDKRSPICKKLFYKNYESLNRRNKKDLEILYETGAIMPFHFFPLTVQEPGSEYFH